MDPILKAALAPLQTKLRSRSIAYCHGRNREVYVMPRRYVVKLPTNGAGCGDNDWEGSVSNTEQGRADPYQVQYPKTRLIYYEQIPIVLMEYIEEASYKQLRAKLGRIPGWVYSVDCGQVGFNKHGRLVAFDYGRN